MFQKMVKPLKLWGIKVGPELAGRNWNISKYCTM